jgi:hypothetical protein
MFNGKISEEFRPVLEQMLAKYKDDDFGNVGVSCPLCETVLGLSNSDHLSESCHLCPWSQEKSFQERQGVHAYFCEFWSRQFCGIGIFSTLKNPRTYSRKAREERIAMIERWLSTPE